ncbi:MAG: LytTR family transcriptional regulator DNA-binding domain-containing protein [Lachnospiraceae bacterium]|nr:LytTR family transcriptional regulator DNA-binding domain-containing protein [Lachnospiraceae bacterium]
MRIDIRQTETEEEYLTLRYREKTPLVEKILQTLAGEDKIEEPAGRKVAESRGFSEKEDIPPAAYGRILGRTEEGSAYISLSDILYLESVDDRVFAYTTRQVVRLDGTLTSFLAAICDESFFRCSKAMILNVNKVAALKSLSSNRIEATMEGGEKILISRRYASDFRKLLKRGSLG